MKILHLFNELKFSGAEIMYVSAAPLFQKLGCKLTVANTSLQLGEYTPAFKTAGYTIIHQYIPHALLRQWKMGKELIQLIKEGGYDVVHIHRSDLRWIMSYCAWRTRCKAVYTTHSVFRSHWYSYPLHFMQRWTAYHLFHCTFQTISDSVDANERNYYHTQTTLIYNWYGSTRFYPATKEEKKQTRLELNIPQDALVIISVGGCSHIKRHHDVIKAMPTILKKYPKAIYLHLGEGNTLEEEKVLAKSLNLNQNVRFYGNQKDVRNFLIASDIYVMPSKFEGISLTTIEAMACNIPAILYNVPGLRDFNKEKECALLIPESTEVLAKSIIELYENPKQQSTLIQNGKEFVDAYFNMEKNARKIFELYTKR